MREIRDIHSVRRDTELAHLLAQRKAPLSAEGMDKVLRDLTYHIAGSTVFYAAVFPKKDALNSTEIHARDIDRVDIMLADDNERYFPVFSDTELLFDWKPELKDGEKIFAMTKQDLLNFLNRNEKVAACVLNPGTDDLLLFRMQLQNMIQVGRSLQG